jgi:hypothetical protein
LRRPGKKTRLFAALLSSRNALIPPLYHFDLLCRHASRYPVTVFLPLSLDLQKRGPFGPSFALSFPLFPVDLLALIFCGFSSLIYFAK